MNGTHMTHTHMQSSWIPCDWKAQIKHSIETPIHATCLESQTGQTHTESEIKETAPQNM